MCLVGYIKFVTAVGKVDVMLIFLDDFVIVQSNLFLLSMKLTLNFIIFIKTQIIVLN